MKIVLIGYMGSGKSSVGEKLASALDFNFKDLDSELELAEGKSISKIFSDNGEIYFRKKENALLKTLLSANENLVLATGGGTPCYSDSMEYMLRNPAVKTVYLKSSLPTLCKRLWEEKGQRPVLAHLNSEVELMDFIGKHLFERTHFYSQANFTINVDGISVKETVENIILKLF